MKPVKPPVRNRAISTSSTLARGDYNLTIKADGFRELQMGPLELTVGEQMTVRPKLELGTVSEVVEVQSAAPPVTTSNSSVSQLVDTKRIEQLPLNGRNALQLVALLPGVVNAGKAGQFGATQVTFSTSGGRNIDMNFTLDGGYNMNSFYSIANEYPNPGRAAGVLHHHAQLYRRFRPRHVLGLCRHPLRNQPVSWFGI